MYKSDFRLNARLSGWIALIAALLFSLSFALPSTAVRAKSRTYQVNKVYVRQLDMMTEPDDDEAAVESGDV